MRNPYKPYLNPQGGWYVSKRGCWYIQKGPFATEDAAKLECVKTYGRDLQSALDECNEYVEKNDPDFRESDPLAYLA